MKLDKLEREAIAVVIQYLLDKSKEGDYEAQKIIDEYVLLGVFNDHENLCRYLSRNWLADAQVNELQRHLLPDDQYYNRLYILTNIRMFIFRLDDKSEVLKKLVYPKY